MGISIISVLVLIVLIYFIIYMFFIGFSKLFSILAVVSTSMEPTLKKGDRILVLCFGYQNLIKRGQIVVLSLPDSIIDIDVTTDTLQEKTSLFVKRLVGLAGDKDIPQFKLTEGIPEGYVFVMGDHPDGADSRHWGAIPLNSIQGIVVARFSIGAKK